MDLAELNRRVTAAITIAEGLPKDSPACWTAFREVSRLEEQIARSTAADDVEGEIARIGAVAAALSANEPLRAIQLGEAYLAEELAEDIAAKIRGMLAEANDVLGAFAGDLTVQPVRFTLDAA